MRRWILGREITDARSVTIKAPVARLVGQSVDAIDAQGKHLLIRFSSGDVLHTHMRMTGSWHVYPRGERWRKAAWKARVVLEAGDRIAVCFDAPVVELLRPGGDTMHAALRALGPDVLDDVLAVDDIVRRARAGDGSAPIGDVLLDQRVVAGIGNIWRNEALFAERVHPAAPLSTIDDELLVALVRKASALMRVSVASARPNAKVYKRAGRPCPRCRALIVAQPMGRDARTAYWCPRCQPERAGG